MYYLVACGLVMAYGWRQIFIGQREKHEMAREKMWARIHLIPLLQAEEDRDQVRRYYADLAREKELLGSQSGAYNSNRYVQTRHTPFGWNRGIREISNFGPARARKIGSNIATVYMRCMHTATPKGKQRNRG